MLNIETAVSRKLAELRDHYDCTVGRWERQLNAIPKGDSLPTLDEIKKAIRKETA